MLCQAPSGYSPVNVTIYYFKIELSMKFPGTVTKADRLKYANCAFTRPRSEIPQLALVIIKIENDLDARINCRDNIINAIPILTG